MCREAKSTSSLQYCAKVMQTKFGEFRSLFSRIFKHNFARNFAKFRARSFSAKQYFERNFKEISLDISEGQTKNRYFENSQKQNFVRQLQ